MKELRLLSNERPLEEYLAAAHELRSRELARLTSTFFHLPGLILKRAVARSTVKVASGS